MVFELKCKILRWAYLEVGEIPSVVDIDEKILGDVRLFGWAVKPLVGVRFPRSLSDELSKVECGLRQACTLETPLPSTFP